MIQFIGLSVTLFFKELIKDKKVSSQTMRFEKIHFTEWTKFCTFRIIIRFLASLYSEHTE